VNALLNSKCENSTIMVASFSYYHFFTSSWYVLMIQPIEEFNRKKKHIAFKKVFKTYKYSAV